MVASSTIVIVSCCAGYAYSDPAGTLTPTSDVSSVFSLADHGDAGVLGIQIYPEQILEGAVYNCEPRWGLSEHVLEMSLSDAVPTNGYITVTATDNYSNEYNATVDIDSNGTTLTATFDPVLPDQRIYTVEG